MINKIRKSVVGGMLGTTAMTLVLFGAPGVGLPQLSPPQMLSSMLDFPILYGWLLHFMIGIIFAMMYVFVISRILKKIHSTMWRGTVLGVFAFIFGQIMINILGTLFAEAPPMAGGMVQTMIVSVLGHLVFGMTVALSADE